MNSSDYLIGDWCLLTEGTLRVGDILKMGGVSVPKGDGHSELYGDSFKVDCYNGLFCLVQEDADGEFPSEPTEDSHYFNIRAFWKALEAQYESHDDDEGYDYEDEESNSASFPCMLEDFNLFLYNTELHRKGKDVVMLGDFEPSEDYTEATLVINDLAKQKSKAKPVVAKAEAKPSKVEKPKRAPALKFSLADLAEALPGDEEVYELDFYILKKEGIKEDFLLECDPEGEWVLTARDNDEVFPTLKDAFIWLNTDVRKEKNLKDITANCVGTKIMLSFIKFNGTTCDKFLNA